MKAKFCHNLFWHNSVCTIVLRADTGNRKIVNFTYALKIYTNYKLSVFRANFIKLKFWKLLSNCYCPKQPLTLKM